MKKRNRIAATLAIACILFAAIKHTHAQSAQPNNTLEVVATLDFRPGNVAVSKEGRVFATAHPLGNSSFQLFEVQKDKTIKPFPDSSFQKNGGTATDHTLDTPLGLTFDKQNNLWVIDMGQTRNQTRLWCFDITTNTRIRVIILPADIAPKGSFIQDLAIDEKNQWAYLADITSPGIIAIDLKTEKARRFGNHPALQSENIDMIIDGTRINFGGAPARVGINPITLSHDRETLYFGAMNGRTWYQIPTALFRNSKEDETIGAAIRKAGSKPISDGAQTDDHGNHYFTNLQEHAVSRLSKDGKLTILIQDTKLAWPDNLSIAPNGYLYISVNQLNTTPAFTGTEDSGKPPYYIYRFKYK